MGGDGKCQTLQIVAALEQADEPAAGDGGRPASMQLPGRPVEIVLGQIDLGQRIAVMRVEAGRNDDQVRREVIERRQDAAIETPRERDRCRWPATAAR